MQYPKRPNPGTRLANRKPWLPDWRDRGQYDWLDERDSSKQFAWEFLRRNPAYQDLVLNRVSFDPSREPPEAQVRQPNESKTEYINRLMRPEYVPHYGYLGFLLQEFCLHTETFQSPSVNDPPRFIPRYSQQMALGEKGAPVVYQVDVQPHEAFIALDLRFPLDWQLPSLRGHFDAARERGISGGLFEPIVRRLQASQYVKYLRILDADTAGEVSTKIIADVLSRDRGSEKPLSEKDVRAARGVAKGLRDSGFRDLATMPERD